MSVTVHFNKHEIKAEKKSSLFEIAVSAGIRVPTSCITQGKCKECLVEISEGMKYLSEPTSKESHLSRKFTPSGKGNFRLSCQTRIISDSGVIRCNTMRRGTMRIETKALKLPPGNTRLKPDPAVTRDGKRVLLDGIEIDKTTEPIHGIAMDLGTTTIVL